MTYEEAEQKALDALDAGLIKVEQVEDYIQHLLKNNR